MSGCIQEFLNANCIFMGKAFTYVWTCTFSWFQSTMECSVLLSWLFGGSEKLWSWLTSRRESFSTLTLTYMHSITELSQKKNFPAKKIDPDSSPAEKSNQNWQKKNGKLENHHICWGKKVVLTIIFLCRMVGSQWVFRIKRLVFSIIPSRFLKNQVWIP